MPDDARPILPDARISPRAAAQMRAFHSDFLGEVQKTIADNDIVIVGMAQNPVVKRAKKLLDDAGLAYAYVGHGSYLSGYRRRLIIKLWSGWPFFPQIFVKGTLIGGADDLKAELDDGTVKSRLAK
jgi:monothiol glutaredoxin